MYEKQVERTIHKLNEVEIEIAIQRLSNILFIVIAYPIKDFPINSVFYT